MQFLPRFALLSGLLVVSRIHGFADASDFAKLLASAQAGDPRTQMLLSVDYFTGKDVPADARKATTGRSNRRSREIPLPKETSP